MDRPTFWGRVWCETSVPVFLERFILPALATVLIGVILLNPLKVDWQQQTSLAVAVVALAYFVGHTVYKNNQRRDVAPAQQPVARLAENPTEATPPSDKPKQAPQSPTKERKAAKKPTARKTKQQSHVEEPAEPNSDFTVETELLSSPPARTIDINNLGAYVGYDALAAINERYEYRFTIRPKSKGPYPPLIRVEFDQSVASGIFFHVKGEGGLRVLARNPSIFDVFGDRRIDLVAPVSLSPENPIVLTVDGNSQCNILSVGPTP
jgi:hypothetical protein